MNEMILTTSNLDSSYRQVQVGNFDLSFRYEDGAHKVTDLYKVIQTHRSRNLGTAERSKGYARQSD